MDYSRIYYSIITSAKKQNRVKHKEGLYENHHIEPKSLGGGNNPENLVLLTPKEHYICHRLLVQIHKGTQYENKMYYAMWCMINGLGNQKRHATSSRIYQVLRQELRGIRSVPRYDNRKPVEQYTLEGIYLHTFNSPTEACQVTGISRGSIENCARNQTKTGSGFIWKYVGDEKQVTPVNYEKSGRKKGSIPYNKGVKYLPGSRNVVYKKVIQYNLNYEPLRVWDTISEASSTLKISRGSIENCATSRSKSAGGFRWKYVNTKKQ